ncbi:MAG: gamma carbonic anhydrase family protein, partial [Caldilineaceae bacterium]|nr:gamma carbonic anhydrase family protein [Caldilineaceae bacterium]
MIIEHMGKQPQIAEGVYLAPTATVIGDVIIEAGANIWFGAVLRGDSGRIVIGPRTSVQDNVVVHVNGHHDTIVEGDVIIGHGVVLEGCRIGQGALLGMNATVLSGAEVGAGA